jgi:acetyl-CoA carboxylase biotin carboxyl carrier protein
MAFKDTPPAKRFDIDGASIRELAQIMVETGLTEIEVSEGERRIKVAKTPAHVTHSAPVNAPMAHPVPGADATTTAAPGAATTPAAGAITSPMVGTAYLRPEPSAPPFVSVGDTVNPGDTLLIIEAMKVMNPIKAAKGGKVSQIMVGDGQPVEFGEILIIVD